MRPERDFTVNPGWGLLMRDMGVSPGNVLRYAGLPGDLFTRDGAALSTEEYFRLWEAVEHEARDPELPVRLATALSAEAFDPPVFAAMCSENLTVAAPRIARYKKLIGPMRLLVSETASAFTITYVWPNNIIPPPLLAASELMFWVALVRLATRENVRPLRITTWAPPSQTPGYVAYLGMRMEGGDNQAITFSHRDAVRPFLTAHAGMWACFEPGLQKRLSELEAEATLEQRVRGALLELLPTGRSTLGAVARALHVSPRTLQRHLGDEATTFQEVLNATRADLARHYLTRSRLPIGEIAFLLGYDDPNSFHRAFQSWTGSTPGMTRIGEGS